MKLERDTVLAALRAEDVANHLGIKGQWRGRWMRSARCGVADHSSDAFGLARDGKWHCWACDSGGDLIKLLALGEGLDPRNDFPKILELAAKIAGVAEEIDFGGEIVKPAPRPRPEPPAVKPIAERIALARKRAAWVWPRLMSRDEMRFSIADNYLAQERGLNPAAVRAREELRETPMRCSNAEAAKHPDLQALLKLFSSAGIAVPVRSPIDGALVDIRIRRFAPREGQPKIVGMLGGVTTTPAEDGKARELVGCYGRPHAIDSDLVVIVEGALDYLTACALWPNADVLGAVDAGSLALVTKVAARALANRDDASRILIVEQNDAPRYDKKLGRELTMADGAVAASDASVNEDPNAATKVAVRILGPRRVGWLFCDGTCGDRKAMNLGPHKDLNDLLRAGVRIAPRWWADFGEAA